MNAKLPCPSAQLAPPPPAAAPCTQLPVDTALEDRKEQLKRSGLGRVVMFYFKLPGARMLRTCSWASWRTSVSYAPAPIALAWSSSQHAAHRIQCTCFEGALPLLAPQTRRRATGGWPRSWWSGGAGPSWPPAARASSVKRRVMAGGWCGVCTGGWRSRRTSPVCCFAALDASAYQLAVAPPCVQERERILQARQQRQAKAAAQAAQARMAEVVSLPRFATRMLPYRAVTACFVRYSCCIVLV